MTDQIKLPPMVVEKRVPTKDHGITNPFLSDDFFKNQLAESMVMNSSAKQLPFLPDDVFNIVSKYIPRMSHTQDEATITLRSVMNMTWEEVCEFVVDDACSEFFTMGLKYCLKEGQKHKSERGFIDGSGIGYMKKYLSDLKPVLEKCFDAKYFHKVPRPLVYARESGLDIAPLANAIHPGHWSFPAGHGTKFLQAVDTLNDIFHLDNDCYKNLFLAACYAAMGRSGNLIHYPVDNLYGGVLTGLEEFNHYNLLVQQL